MLRRFSLVVALLACALVSFGAAAQVPPRSFVTPESGFWWNPSEPGSGLAIEIQDNTLFLAGYVYDSQGFSSWVTAQGPLTYSYDTSGNLTDVRFAGGLDSFSNGQCIGCAWRAPSYLGQPQGAVLIDFHTEEARATLSWGGRSFNIERFNFVLGDRTQQMRGEWQMVIDFQRRSGSDYSFYPFYGDVMVIDLVDTTPNPDQFIGCRPFDSRAGFCTNADVAAHDLAGYYSGHTSSGDRYVIVLTDFAGSSTASKSFFAYYVLAGLGQFDGVMEICQPNQCGFSGATYYPVRGLRTASLTFVRTGVGPSSTEKSASASAGSLTQALRASHGDLLPAGLSADEVKARYGIDVQALAPDAQRLTRELEARK